MGTGGVDSEVAEEGLCSPMLYSQIILDHGFERMPGIQNVDDLLYIYRIRRSESKINLVNTISQGL